MLAVPVATPVACSCSPLAYATIAIPVLSLAQADALLMSCWNAPLLSEKVPTAITFWAVPAAIVLFEGPTASALIVESDTDNDVLPLWPRLAEMVAVSAVRWRLLRVRFGNRRNTRFAIHGDRGPRISRAQRDIQQRHFVPGFQ